MFGRLATYFVLGDICILGWIINETFEEQSGRFITVIAAALFLVFIIYDNRTIDGYGGYTSISLLEYLSGVH